MTDLLLACAHHGLVFALLGLLAAELAIVARGVRSADVRVLASLDGLYGMMAMGIIAIGFGRVFMGAKGSGFFLHNPVFWAKLGCFLLVGLVSALPTLRFVRWKKQQRADPGFAPAPVEVALVRRWIATELALFVPIPLLAAAMARGYGL
jgi:putative membrane protein